MQLWGESILGIIDSISAGYAAVNRRFEILLIPVILDLYLWLGPRISIGGMVRGWVTQLAPPPGAGGEYDAAIQDAQALLIEGGNAFNVFSVATPGFLGVPGLIGGGEAGLAALGISQRVIELRSLGLLAALVLGLLVLSALLGAAFLELLATEVRREGRSAPGVPGRILKLWLRLLKLGAAILAVALVLGIPGSFAIGVVMMISPAVASLLIGVAWVIVFWMAIYVIFLIQSLVINETGLRKAIYLSLNVLRRNIWPAIGLIVVVQLISMGMPIVWGFLTRHPVGTPVGIVANAYIGSGLTAALLVFYRDRFNKWIAQVKPIEEARAQSNGTIG